MCILMSSQDKKIRLSTSAIVSKDYFHGFNNGTFTLRVRHSELFIQEPATLSPNGFAEMFKNYQFKQPLQQGRSLCSYARVPHTQ